jgi:hypothetical protein
MSNELVESIKENTLLHFGETGNYSNIIFYAFQFTEQGNHTKNPYHNERHCYAVLELSLKYLTMANVPAANFYEELALCLAALFHDYNHSGSPLSVVEDKINIKAAIAGLRVFKDSLKEDRVSKACTFHLMFDLAEEAIKCTRVKVVNGIITFPKKPETLIQEILRDSDVTMPLSELGRTLNKGLAKEMGKPYNKTFRKSSIAFLNNVRLYTDVACDLRDEQLDFLEAEWG